MCKAQLEVSHLYKTVKQRLTGHLFKAPLLGLSARGFVRLALKCHSQARKPAFGGYEAFFQEVRDAIWLKGCLFFSMLPRSQ